MSNPNQTFSIGDATITRITELTMDQSSPDYLFPHWQKEAGEENSPWLKPDHMTADGRFLRQSVHSWLVQTPDYTVLIDTCAGNDKQRPLNPLFHAMQTPWLAKLAAAGVAVTDIDYVINTHLHVDHVGWNTVLWDGRWQPLFPRANYLFSGVEYDFYRNPAHVKTPSQGIFEDSVQPVVDAGQVVFIEDIPPGLLPGIAFHYTPGHSVNHFSVELNRAGHIGLFAGDVMHHPLQVVRPQWNSVYCEFPQQALASRRWALDFCADHNAVYFSSHFAGTSAGYIERIEGGLKWVQL